MKRRIKKSYFWPVLGLAVSMFCAAFIYLVGAYHEKSLAEWYQFDRIIVRERHMHYSTMEVLANEIVRMQREGEKFLDKQKKSF